MPLSSREGGGLSGRATKKRTFVTNREEYSWQEKKYEPWYEDSQIFYRVSNHNLHIVELLVNRIQIQMRQGEWDLDPDYTISGNSDTKG